MYSHQKQQPAWPFPEKALATERTTGKQPEILFSANTTLAIALGTAATYSRLLAFPSKLPIMSLKIVQNLK